MGQNILQIQITLPTIYPKQAKKRASQKETKRTISPFKKKECLHNVGRQMATGKAKA